jgi:plastocyanin
MSRRLIPGVILGVMALGLFASAGLAAEPTVEATGNSLATYAWAPSTAAVDSGGSVAFKNPTANFHGLAWENPPANPDCTGTPSVGQANWSGSCTFAQGGTYKFYCPVHPAQMKGTITVNGPAAPVVSTGSPTAVGETEATLNGTVNPSEQETSYFFEYGTTTADGDKTAEGSAGSGASPVAKSATVTGLTPSTTYHFRLVAENATGTSHGIDRTFKTAGPEEPTPPVEPPPAVEPAPVTDVSPPPPAATTPPAATPVSQPPDTKLMFKPRAKTKDRTPTFKFTASTAGAAFRCSIDGKPFKACLSPYTAPSLKPGRHTFRVAAVAGGLTDSTAAAWTFKVVGRKK